ncbi:MAG: hemerythrin family protein [bacterium]|nr:hemerythrin family protein [bacterium]
MRPTWQPEMYDPHNVGPTWRPHMATGLEWQDQRHQELLNKLDELCQAVQYYAGASVVNGLLDFLDDYSQSHFRQEEQYMARNKCGSCAEHQQCHELFKVQLHDVRALYASQGPSTLVILKLQTWLRRWLAMHILTLDRHLTDSASPEQQSRPQP